MRRRYLVVALLSMAVLATFASTTWAGPKKAKSRPFVPPNWPANTAPMNWPTNPGTRLKMSDFAAKHPADQRCWKVKVVGQTAEQHKAGTMGTFSVGDTVKFNALVSDRESEFFGSIKDGSDGGKYQGTIFWMDESGKKVLAEDKTSVRLSCATCAGYWSFYFNVPSTARTGKHRLHLSYTHDKLKMNVTRDLYFQVNNDGSWDFSEELTAARAKYDKVLVLQTGTKVNGLGDETYNGVRDTYMMSPNRVPDRRADHCNFGSLAYLRIGRYGQAKRSLVAFDLTKVPADARIAEAHLQLYIWSFDGARGPGRLDVTAYEVLKNWQEGRGNGSRWRKDPVVSGEASWQCSAYPAKWSEPGCGGAGTDRSAEPVGQAKRVDRKVKFWVSIPLDKKMVARWIAHRQTNRGVMLEDPKGGCGVFHSSQFEDPAMRPRLILALANGADKKTASSK